MIAIKRIRVPLVGSCSGAALAVTVCLMQLVDPLAGARSDGCECRSCGGCIVPWWFCAIAFGRYRFAATIGGALAAVPVRAGRGRDGSIVVCVGGVYDFWRRCRRSRRPDFGRFQDAYNEFRGVGCHSLEVAADIASTVGPATAVCWQTFAGS